MAYLRDPNALDILRRNQPQIPRYTDEEYALRDMVPEQDLMEAQQGDVTPGKPHFIPSRESLQNSAVARLKHYFTNQRAEADARTAPEVLRGYFGLQQEQMRGQSAVQMSRERAQLAEEAAERAERGRNERSDAAISARRDIAAGSQEGMSGRTNQTQQRLANQFEQMQTQRREEKGTGEYGLANWIKSLFGYGSGAPAASSAPASPATGSEGGEYEVSPEEDAYIQEYLRQRRGGQ